MSFATESIIAITAFLVGLAVGLGYARIHNKDLDADLKKAYELGDFWRENAHNWHQIAIDAGLAGPERIPSPVGSLPEKCMRITVPDPPQAEIVAAGKVGLKVWRN